MAKLVTNDTCIKENIKSIKNIFFMHTNLKHYAYTWKYNTAHGLIPNNLSV
jgi:hypothetical protein